MKQILLAASIVASGLLTTSCGNAQRMHVSVRPVAPVMVRHAAPRPTAVWIGPEWVWRGGSYVYVNGYWANPRVGYRYTPGYWRKTRRGDVWVAGGWVR
jgi:hypothetical protein